MMLDITKLFKALANENRLNILKLLIENNCICQDIPSSFNSKDLPEGYHCVQEIVEKFNMIQATISHHLGELNNAELLTRHKVGPWVYYLVGYETTEKIKWFLGGRRVPEDYS